MPSFPEARSAIILGIPLAAFVATSYCQQPIYSGGQVYDETRIRAMAYPLGNAALNETHSASSYWLDGAVPFGTDGIVGLATTVHSDNRLEAFPAHRVTGWVQGAAPPIGNADRYGAWVEYFRFTGTSPSFYSKVTNNNKHNFFTSFQPGDWRTFSSTSNSRGFSKVEFVCPSTCGTSNVSAYYFKIGGWNMSSKPSLRFPLPSSTLNPGDIVNLEAVIHSDAISGNDIIVDKLDHIAKRSYPSSTTPTEIGKGGLIWFGNGCQTLNCTNDGATTSRIILFAGMVKPPHVTRSSYRGADFRWQASSANTPIPYSSTAKNRGWVKIEFANKPVPQIPHAIKSKAVAIGAWNMRTADQMPPIPLSRFGITGNRIVGMNMIIQSDPKNSESIDAPGTQFTNFNMHPWESPQGFDVGPAGGGGVTLVRNGSVHSVSYRKEWSPTERYNFYSDHHSLTTLNGPTYNRGWVKLDYLAGSCEQGGSGFLLKAIPSSMIGSCTGTGNLVLEGAGADIWNNADEFTYVYKAINASSTPTARTFQAKIETLGNSEGWAKTGVMVRMGTDAGSPHISMFVTPSNGVQFTKRNSANGSTSHVGQTSTSVKAPLWLRVVRNGNNYTGWYSTTGTTWTQVGGSTSLTTSSTYYAGLAATSRSASMNVSTLSGLQF